MRENPSRKGFVPIILLIIGIIAVVIMSTFLFIWVKPYFFPPYRLIQTQWQKINAAPYPNPASLGSLCQSEKLQWKGGMYEGANCRNYIDEQGRPSQQYWRFQLRKDDQSIWLSDHYIQEFKLFDCGDYLCIIGNSEDRPRDIPILAETMPKFDLTVIFWPSKKQLIYSNPCSYIPQINDLHIEQINTKEFSITAGCRNARNIIDTVYQTSINIAGN